MPKEATEIGYIQGVIESYGMLGRLYYYQKLYDKSIENLEIALKMDEEYKINDFNIAVKYIFISWSCLEIGDFDKAEKYLKIGLENSPVDASRANVLRGFIKLYIRKGDLVQAKNYLDSVKLAKYQPDNNIDDILSLEAQYYYAKGDYRKSLTKYDSLDMIRPLSSSVMHKEALCNYHLGNYKRSSELLLHTMDIRDSVEKVEKGNQVMEQMVLMEVESINAEKHKLALRLREARLFYAKIIIYIMLVLLSFFAYLAWKYHKLNIRLKKSESMKGQFINHLSHEVRTPLNSIVGFSDLIAQGGLSEKEMDKCSTIIHENSDSLLKMVSEAMDVTDVDSIGIYEKVSINDICREAVEASQVKAHAGIPIIFRPNSRDRKSILNKAKIIKILNALLDNSIRFTKEGSITVEIRTATINFENKIVVSVTDTGIGIPQSQHEVVFKFYEKVDEFNLGLGIGLPVSRLLAESMNGSLNIDKGYTRGTRMVLTIPLK